MDNGIKLYMKQHGDTVAGKKIEIIRKDTGGIAPDVAKRLAQELIVRDKRRHPRRLRAHAERARGRRRVGAGQEVHGDDERGDLDHHDQVALHGAHLVHGAAAQRGARHLGLQERHPQGLHAWSPTSARAMTARPRSSRASRRPAARSSARSRYPVANPDFSAFVQRAKDVNPEAIYIWVPGGAQPAAIGKALRRARHRSEARPRCSGQGELTAEDALKSMGDAGARHHHRVPLRLQPRVGEEQGVRREPTTPSFKRNPDMFSVGGYDGMHLIYEALKKTDGKTDGEALIAAAKGMTWESPRGPDVDRSGDPRRGADRLHPPRREGRRRAASTSSSTRSRTSRTRSRRG